MTVGAKHPWKGSTYIPICSPHRPPQRRKQSNRKVWRTRCDGSKWLLYHNLIRYVDKSNEYIILPEIGHLSQWTDSESGVVEHGLIMNRLSPLQHVHVVRSCIQFPSKREKCLWNFALKGKCTSTHRQLWRLWCLDNVLTFELWMDFALVPAGHKF